MFGWSFGTFVKTQNLLWILKIYLNFWIQLSANTAQESIPPAYVAWRAGTSKRLGSQFWANNLLRERRNKTEWTTVTSEFWAGIFNESMGEGTEEEEGYRTGEPGYIGWRNSFLGIDSGAPYTYKNTGSAEFRMFHETKNLRNSIPSHSTEHKRYQNFVTNHSKAWIFSERTNLENKIFNIFWSDRMRYEINGWTYALTERLFCDTSWSMRLKMIWTKFLLPGWHP